MKYKSILRCLLAAVVVLSLTGCLTHRTVTQGGRTVKDDYVFKRPLKDAFRNSQ